MFTETDTIDKKKTCDPLSNEKETSKVDSSFIVESDFTKAESVLFSTKTNLIEEMPLEQSDKPRSSTGFVTNYLCNLSFDSVGFTLIFVV